MASRQAIGRCFDLLESAGFLAPDGWRQPKTPDGDARRAAARRATGEAWELALGHAGVDDATLMTAVATLMAHTAERYWPTPGVLIGYIRTPDAKHNREGAADAALAELRARSRKWKAGPVSPDCADCEIIPPRPVMVSTRLATRALPHNATDSWGNPIRVYQLTDAQGAPIIRDAHRADGGWRVAGDELRQTDRELEVVVWRVLRALGGIDALRLASGDENSAAWGAYAATWRRQWAAMADEDAHARRMIGQTGGLQQLADHADRDAVAKMRGAMAAVEAATRRP